MKDNIIQARITSKMKERFKKCLEYEGITITDFLNSEVRKFVEKTEKKMEEKKG